MLDTAIANLRDCIDSLGLTFDLDSITETEVVGTVVKKDLTYNVWYDENSECYGFNLLQGGVKTYKSIDDFKDYFKTYVYINSEFIPNAKVVADVFEKALNLTTIYKTFAGSTSGGVTAIFSILDSSDEVHIFCEDDKKTYSVKLMVFGKDKTKAKVLLNYKYLVDEVKNCRLLPSIDWFFNTFESTENYILERTGKSSFNITFGEKVYNVELDFEGFDITFNIVKFNDISCDLQVVSNINILNSLELLKDAELLFITSEEKSIEKDDDFEYEETENLDSDDFEYENEEEDSSSEVEESIEEESTEEEPIDEEVITEEVVTEDMIEEDSSEVSEKVTDNVEESNTVDFEVKVIKDINNEIDCVRFSNREEIYDIPLALVSKYLPVKYIQNSETRMLYRGIAITQEERQKHKFAIELTDENKIIELVNSLF